MKPRIMEGRPAKEEGSEILDVLAASDTPALATDAVGHIIFWNRAAERLLGRPTGQALGRRCYDVLGGRDIFGNRFCHENCSVVSMSRNGETVQGFELTLGMASLQERAVNVTILKIPGVPPELFTLVHVLQPIDKETRLTRALERLGGKRTGNGHASDGEAMVPAGPVLLPKAPPLSHREREILRLVAEGLQNKEVAQVLGISLATARNHIHNILTKLEVHSKLEAVSLAFRQGWVADPTRKHVREMPGAR